MDVLGVASSGLSAAQSLLNTAANNIANANTPGYQAQRTDLVDVSTGGVAVAGIQSTGQSVDLPTEFENLTRAKLLYTANAALVSIYQRMTGSLLDMFDNQDRKS
jgi:flagellar basal-body rod protein FlgC